MTLENPTTPDMPDDPLADQVQALAQEVGGTVQTSRYDCGTSVTITVPGKGQARVSIDCGEEYAPALTLLRARLVEGGMLAGPKRKFTLTYPGGRVLNIWAIDEGQAVKLAMQGQPEKIEVVDATT